MPSTVGDLTYIFIYYSSVAPKDFINKKFWKRNIFSVTQLPFGGGGNLNDFALKKPGIACGCHTQHRQSKTVFHAVLGRSFPDSCNQCSGAAQEPRELGRGSPSKDAREMWRTSPQEIHSNVGGRAGLAFPQWSVLLQQMGNCIPQPHSWLYGVVYFGDTLGPVSPSAVPCQEMYSSCQD